MVKSNLAKLMKEKKLTYRRLSELSGIAGETIRACLETHLSIMKRFNSMLAMAI